MMERVIRDIRHAIRSLRGSPRFTATVLIVLAVGIGANTAVFAVADRMLLRPSPYPEAERLVIFGYTFNGTWVPSASEAKLNVWREFSRSALIAGIRLGTADMTDAIDPEQLAVAWVSSEFFPLIGASLAEGRGFTTDDDHPGREPGVILSYALWQRRFGGRPGVVGRTIPIDGRLLSIVGIAGRQVDTTLFGTEPALWLPLQLDRASVSHPPSLRAIARLRPGATLASANDEARRAGDEFARRFAGVAGANDTFALQPLQQTMVSDIRTSLLVLVGAMVCLLLIACANVSNLMLARGSERQREFAIRSAVGASPLRLTSQLTIESLVLSLAAGVLGFAGAVVALNVAAAIDPGGVISMGTLAQGDLLTTRVIVFGAFASLTTGMLCGGVPALSAVRHAHLAARASTGGRAGTGPAQQRTRSLLVVAEVSLAGVLLIGAVLLIRTFVALHIVDRGFDAAQVVAMKMSLAGVRPTDAPSMARIVREGIERLSSIPGVASVAASCCVPLEADWRASILFSTPTVNAGGEDLVSERIVSDGYFKVLAVPVVAGRSFGPLDGPRSQAVALVNETMAHRYWPNGNAIGQFVTVFPGISPTDEPRRQIVGIVRDMRDGLPLDQETRSTVFVPLTQMENSQIGHFARTEPLVWLLRTHADVRGITRLAELELQRLSRNRPVTDVQSLVQVRDQSMDSTRFYGVILTTFAVCALLLASVGLYGVASYAVEQRVHELGIRLALGAEPRRLRAMVLAYGLKLAVPGAALGMVLALGLTRFLSSALFGVAPHDPMSFALVPLLLIATAIAAVSAPARRVMRLNPIEAIRRE
jgi:putative ABC transport system permease protein